MFPLVSGNPSMAADDFKSNTVFAMGIQQPLELTNSYTQFQPFECNVTCVWAFLSSMLYLQKAWSPSTLNTLKAHVSFAGQHAQAHLATCNTSATRAEKGSLFGSSNRFSTATRDPTFILQPLLGSDPFGISQGHSGSESNEPSLHQILQNVSPKCSPSSVC